MPIEVSAAERARWLADLADALEQAERLVWSLGNSRDDNPELMELYGRLDAARAEVQALRFRRAGRDQVELQPFWTSLAPWPAEKGAADN